MRIIRVIKALIAAAFKAQIRHRFDFAMGVISDLLIQLISLAYVLILYDRFPVLGRWNQQEMLFIFGFSQIVTGLCAIFLVPLTMVGDYYMYQGHLDRVLLRPYPSIIGVLFEEAVFFDFGNLLLGCLVVGVVGANLRIWSALNVFLAVILVVSSFALVGSLLLFGAALALVFHDRFQILYLLIRSSQQFSFYPLDLFPRLIRSFITYGIPLALGSFYPAVVLLGHHSVMLPVILALPSLLLPLSLIAWNAGVSRYDSTGN